MQDWHYDEFTCWTSKAVARGRGSGGCSSPNKMSTQVTMTKETMTLYSGPEAGCVWRTSANVLNLNNVARIEFDVVTSGKGSNWYSVWLNPEVYEQPPVNSGEIDFIEGNTPDWGNNNAWTQFAGCNNGVTCKPVDWGVSLNAVHAHVTMVYDPSSKIVNVYHCTFGEPSCPPSSNGGWIDLNYFPPGNNPSFLIVIDIWDTIPANKFVMSVIDFQVFGHSGEVLSEHCTKKCTKDGDNPYAANGAYTPCCSPLVQCNEPPNS